MKDIKDVIKFETVEDNDKFINDLNENYPKYKKALFEYYESNNEKFPFEEFSFKDDLVLVIFLNEYGYSHEIVLKALDDFLINNLDSKISLMYILSFLYGLGIINESEMKERNELDKIFANVI